MLNWGIIGAGRIARKFAVGLRSSTEGRLLAVASREQARAETIAAELGAPVAHGSYEALLADPQVGAVYIALPNSMHPEWAIRAAQAGKHILCEKPLAPTAAQAEEMFAAARDNQVWLMEAFMYRFHPRTLALADLLRANTIGQVRLVRIGFSFTHDRPEDTRWRPEMAGGSLYDVGSYTVNMARMAVGSLPQRVWASAQWSESGVDETLAGTLEYAGGAIAQIMCSFRASFQQQLQIVGNEGVIEVDQAFTMHPDQATHIRLWRGNHFAQLERIDIQPTNHYCLEADGFARLIQAGHMAHGLPEMPLQETLDNLTTIEALLRSARAGSAVVIPQSEGRSG
jgi:D-xylose 1-dehydrogenase (NADP+, D-xylono-1,5-lactone-forming)